MSGSLKEELLKLGLGRNLKPAEPERRKRTAPRPKAERPRPAPVVPAPKPAPRAPDPREVDRERARRQMRVVEQLEAHKLDDAQAEIRHYYPTRRKIKYTYVTEAQQKALLAGEIVIVVAHGRGRLVSSSLLPNLRVIDPELRVVDPHATAPASEDDDPEHQVPDDLRW